MARPRRGKTQAAARRRPVSQPFWSRWSWGLSGTLRAWLRRAAIALLLVFVVLPLALILLYRVVPPPVTPLMLIRVAEGQGLQRDWVPWGEISPQLRQAVVAAEDNLFCEHSGFDWRSLATAAKAYAAGERAGGGSTLSMQRSAEDTPE